MAENTGCGLWPISDRLHLWTTATVRSHAMLSHWLAHYASIGVQVATHAHVHLHQDFATAATVGKARAVLQEHGVRDMVMVSSMNASTLEGNKLDRLNLFIRSLKADDWLIFADVDEFFAYPCDLLAQMRASSDRHGRPKRAACAFMQDRVAADGSLPRVKRRPFVAEQFPVCAKVRGLGKSALVVGNILKISLLGARIRDGVPVYETAHRVEVKTSDRLHPYRSIGGLPQTDNGCVFTGRFSHYSMTLETQLLARRKAADDEQRAVYGRVTRLAGPCAWSRPALGTAPWRPPPAPLDPQHDDDERTAHECMSLLPHAQRYVNATRIPCQATCNVSRCATASSERATRNATASDGLPL